MDGKLVEEMLWKFVTIDESNNNNNDNDDNDDDDDDDDDSSNLPPPGTDPPFSFRTAHSYSNSRSHLYVGCG
jgi:phosphopantothenoylcysteine synthetase/decarboxylase